MPTVTPRLALAQVIGSDSPAEIRIGDTANMATLDNATMYRSGTFAARATLSGLVAGTLYYATDTGLLYEWNGTVWQTVQFALVPRAASANVTAVSGQVILALGASFNVTLPAPSVNALVGVVNYWTLASGPFPVRVVAPSGLIFGVGLGGAATSVLLGAQGASVVLHSDGTNWFVISGQQDTGWVPLALNTGSGVVTQTGAYTPSARLIGDRVWLKGIMTTTSSVASGATWATVPAGLQPTAAIPVEFPTLLLGLIPAGLAISSSGAITTNNTINTPGVLTLDGISYSIS